jgi:hypothetical protein
VPGQKTNATVNRQSARDLPRAKGGKSIDTIVPVIRVNSNQKKLARIDEFHKVVSLITDALPGARNDKCLSWRHLSR